MKDYIVVGAGLSGVCFARTLEQHNKDFVVISNGSQTASLVAGGMYNPVILKRFTLAWKAAELLEIAKPFYQSLEQDLGCKLDYKIPVYRVFNSVEEQNGWFEASDKPGLSDFMAPKIHLNANKAIKAPFGYGEVLHTGKIDVATLLNTYTAHLQKKEARLNIGQAFLQADFNFEELEIHDDHISYRGIDAKKIVFAMGYGLKEDPYFNYLPLQGTKGQLLEIKAPELKESKVVKAGAFIIPDKEGVYKVGATYEHKDKTNAISEEARMVLQEKLEKFVSCSYTVTSQKAGVRPTVSDRKPLVGVHPKHDSLFVLNGMGSRGVMNAPYCAKQLFEYIENSKTLDSEIDINRFYKRYLKQL